MRGGGHCVGRVLCGEVLRGGLLCGSVEAWGRAWQWHAWWGGGIPKSKGHAGGIRMLVSRTPSFIEPNPTPIRPNMQTIARNVEPDPTPLSM